MYSIYTLIDPREPEDIRYVGLTKRNIQRRLTEHCTPREINLHRNHRTNWIRELLKAGVKPLIIEIANCATLEDANFCETLCIKQFQKFCNLVNGTEGGDGTAGRKVTNKHKKALSMAHKGKTRPLEVCMKISNTLKGHTHSEETRNKIAATLRNKGIKPKVQFSRKGIPLTAEHKAKIGNANKKKVNAL